MRSAAAVRGNASDRSALNDDVMRVNPRAAAAANEPAARLRHCDVLAGLRRGHRRSFRCLRRTVGLAHIERAALSLDRRAEHRPRLVAKIIRH